MLSAAATRKFRSVGGMLKAILLSSCVLDVLPRALVQHGVWTGALSRRRESREK